MKPEFCFAFHKTGSWVLLIKLKSISSPNLSGIQGDKWGICVEDTYLEEGRE